MHYFNSFLTQKDVPFHLLTKEIWEKLDNIKHENKTDVIHRILAECFKRSYHQLLKKEGFSHKENGNSPFIIGHPVGDHAGALKEGNKTLFTTFEPYPCHKDSIRKLIEECDKRNLDFTITGESPHFVGRTFMIKIYKKPKNET